MIYQLLKLRAGFEPAMAMVVLALGVLDVRALSQEGTNHAGPSSEVTQPMVDPAYGRGVMVAGELWDSFMPASTGPFYGEATQPIIRTLIRIGNFDRSWTTPTHMWPGGWTNGNYWGKWMLMLERNPDPTFNPPQVGGVSNPAYDAASGPNYAHAAFKSTLLGASDAMRNYARETYWVNPLKRDHAIYEAGWPTSIGVDVKMKVHQWTLNWNNFNDFILVELTLTNTGNVDINCDGTAEKTDNVIRALTLMAGGEFMCSYSLSRIGSRSNRFGAGRIIGYVADNDPSGSPWDMMVGYPGESAAGVKDMGLNDFVSRFYADIWSAWTWLGAKQGTGPAGADKQTIFGTHPLGTGPQRGWFSSAGQGRGLSAPSITAAKTMHVLSMGTWYTDGGKSRDASKLNLRPDPNFFASGDSGKPETFVPKAAPGKPRGDRKLYSEEIGQGAFESPTFEPGFAKGFNAATNFDGDAFSGIGPFRLDVGETMTVYWVEAGGYRFKGVANAIAASRYALEKGFALPDPPPVPDLLVRKPQDTPVRVFWDNWAESGSRFAGYKVYRASSLDNIDWLAGGMRGLDHYWKNTSPGPTPEPLKEPVNPDFAGQVFVSGRYGMPDSWGPYTLINVLPKASLSKYADGSVAGYAYSYADTTAPMGSNLWYYVAAYTDTLYDLGPSYAGYGERTSASLESSNLNRNGASGLWMNTYPFADLNTFFPRTPQGLKEIGAPVQRRPLLAIDQISFGTVAVGTSLDLSALLSNSADDTVIVTMTTTNPVFSPVNARVALSAGESLKVTFRYSPIGARKDTALLLFAWNGLPYADTLRAVGSGSSSEFYARPLWTAIGSQVTASPLPLLLAADKAGNVYSSTVRWPMGRGWFLDLEKRSPSGMLLWSRSDSVVGSLPSVTGLEISSTGNIYVLQSNHPARLRAYNSDGVLQWMWEYGRQLTLAAAADMVLDSAGNALVTGTAYWSSRNTRIFVAKVNAAGVEQWSAMYDFVDSPIDSNDTGTAIALDAAGNVAVIGSVASYGGDVVVFQCNSNGGMEWSRIIDYGGTNETGRDIAADGAGNWYATGQADRFTGGKDIITARYSSTGVRDWQKVYPSAPGKSASVSRLAVGKDGSLYAAGSMQEGVQYADYLTLRYDRSGNLMWARAYDGPAGKDDFALLVATDNETDLYVSGQSLGSTGSNGIATIRYRADDGRTVWEARHESSGDASPTALTLAPGQNVLVGGNALNAGERRSVVIKYGQIAVPVAEDGPAVPTGWVLEQNFPNPFNPSTTIRYSLPNRSLVTLTVFNILGQRVSTLVNGDMEAGYHQAQFDGTGFSSGVYFYRITADTFVETKRLLLVR